MIHLHFLSHYFIDRLEHNPYLVVGALLPDIAPHFTQTYNRKIRNKVWDLEEPMRTIHRGVLRHYEADGAFHQSPTFSELCKTAIQCMMQTGLDRNRFRLSFLAHIAVEVLLDRWLIVENKHLTDAYYNILNEVAFNKLDSYLSNVVSEIEKTKILNNFMRFKEVQFLYHLIQIEGAAEGIMRTAHRAATIIFSAEEKQKLIAALHNIESQIRYRGEKLLELNLNGL